MLHLHEMTKPLCLSIYSAHYCGPAILLIVPIYPSAPSGDLLVTPTVLFKHLTSHASRGSILSMNKHDRFKI